MSDDKLSFLEEKDQAEPPAPEPKVTEIPAAEPTPEPGTEPPKVEPAAPTIPPGYIPLAAQLDERDKRQAVERKLAEAQAKLDEFTKQQQPRIDPLTDPEGWAAEQRQIVAEAKQDVLFTTTHMFATRQHGADTVAAAEAWLGQEVQANPAFFQTVARQSDPYEFVVQQYKRSVALAKMDGKDPEAWAEEWAKTKGYVIPQRDANGQFVTAAPAPVTPAPLPKPSLASAPAASGNAPKTPMGPGVAFDEAFKN